MVIVNAGAHYREDHHFIDSMTEAAKFLSTYTDEKFIVFRNTVPGIIIIYITYYSLLINLIQVTMIQHHFLLLFHLSKKQRDMFKV